MLIFIFYFCYLLTITADNGLEFAKHKAIASALACQYYFAHRYHSWERGNNENLNGLIRQYFPKNVIFDHNNAEKSKSVQISLIIFQENGLNIKHPMKPFTDRIRT